MKEQIFKSPICTSDRVSAHRKDDGTIAYCYFYSITSSIRLTVYKDRVLYTDTRDDGEHDHGPMDKERIEFYLHGINNIDFRGHLDVKKFMIDRMLEIKPFEPDPDSLKALLARIRNKSS